MNKENAQEHAELAAIEAAEDFQKEFGFTWSERLVRNVVVKDESQEEAAEKWFSGESKVWDPPKTLCSEPVKKTLEIKWSGKA